LYWFFPILTYSKAMNTHSYNEQELHRIEELSSLRELNINPYPYTFDRTHTSKDILATFSDENPEALSSVSVAGRIMAIRTMGKASFWHILDQDGRIQIYLKKDDLPDMYEHLKLFDIGDIIGVEGYVFRTKVGEVSIHVRTITLLSKSIRMLPIAKEEITESGEKIVHDAFKDKESRYRRRYVDLIVNSDIRTTFIKRSKIITAMRRYFDERNWLEVETPILQPMYGGASARPFVTHHNTLDVDLYLRIADELYLKRLLVGGFEGVYEISKNFRNEGMDKSHNPEYTAMEIYVAYKDYHWMMEMTEDCLNTIAKSVNGSETVIYDGKEISFALPFARKKMSELFVETIGVNPFGFDRASLKELAQKHSVAIDPTANEIKILDEMFSELIQPKLIQPTFVYDYPLEMSPLAKSHRTEQGVVERFELFINGGEVANAFSELNDPFDQRQRLEQQARLKTEGDDEAMVVDEDFLFALEIGMPPAAGLGIGIDRLVMILTGETSIRDVLFFPQMRPEVS